MPSGLENPWAYVWIALWPSRKQHGYQQMFQPQIISPNISGLAHPYSTEKSFKFHYCILFFVFYKPQIIGSCMLALTPNIVLHHHKKIITLQFLIVLRPITPPPKCQNSKKQRENKTKKSKASSISSGDSDWFSGHRNKSFISSSDNFNSSCDFGNIPIVDKNSTWKKKLWQ